MMNTRTIRTESEHLVRLGNELYQRALVRREHEPITDPKGQPIGWLLDTRIPMLHGDLFRRVGEFLVERLENRGIRQVAGYGFGAYPLVCAVLATDARVGFRGGFIRETPKPYGRHRLIEGPIEQDEPVALLDDILNSGRSAGRALSLLRSDGYAVAGMVTLFNFAWSQGKRRLHNEGLWVESLVDLNLRAAPGDAASNDSGGQLS